MTGCFGGFSFAKGELSKFKRASQSAGTDSVALLLGDTMGPTSVYERSSKDGTFGRWLSSVGFDVISFSHRDLIFSPLDARAFTRSVTSMALVASNIDPRADPLFNVAASRMVTLPSGLRVLAVSLFSPNKVKEVRDMGPLRIVNEYAALASVVTGALGAADPADLVVLLAKDQIFDDLLQLTLALPRVDVVVSDLDLTFSGNVTLDPVTGVPRTAWVSMPSTSAIGGRAYGMATVKFDAQGRLVPLAAQELARLRGGAGVVKLTSASASDPALTADINVVRDAIIASQSVPIGSTRRLLDGSRLSCRLQECTLGSALADSVHEWATAALIESRSGPAAKDLTGIAAIINGGFVRSSISAGNITEQSTRAAFPFVSSNTLLILSGAQLYRTLKWSVNDWAKLNASGSGVGGFLQVSRGLRYSYDPVAQRFASIDVLRPSTGRMEPISHNGTYAVGMLNFVSDGGDGYTWLAPVARLVTEDDSRAIFDRYLKTFSPLSLEAGSRIAIASGKYRSEELFLRCAAGYTQPADSEFQCQACQAGTFKATEFECRQCKSNFWSEAGSNNCTWAGIKVVRDVTIPQSMKTAFIVIVALVEIITFACALLVYLKRDLPLIRMSSPPFIICTMVGCAVGLVCILISAYETLSAGTCIAWYWCLAISFTLVFASVFVKLHRIFRIFSATTHNVGLIQGLQSQSLFAIIGFFLAIDVVVLGVWTGVSPLTPGFQEQGDDQSSVKVAVCLGPGYSKQIFLGILASIKCILIIWGTYLAVKTRKVKLKDMNESRMLALCMYTMFLVLCLIAPVSYIVSRNFENIAALFVLVNISILIVILTVIILLAGTKLWLIFVKKRTTLGERAERDSVSQAGPSVIHRGVLDRSNSFVTQDTPTMRSRSLIAAANSSPPQSPSAEDQASAKLIRALEERLKLKDEQIKTLTSQIKQQHKQPSEDVITVGDSTKEQQQQQQQQQEQALDLPGLCRLELVSEVATLDEATAEAKEPESNVHQDDPEPTIEIHIDEPTV